MKRILLLVALATLAGCEGPPRLYEEQKPVCDTPELRQNVADFVVQCAKAANPMSDEEGEDLVAECRRSGMLMLCPEQTFTYNYSNGKGRYNYRLKEELSIEARNP